MHLDQSAARRLEPIEVGVGRVQRLRRLGRGEFCIGIEVDAPEIPARPFEDHIREESDAERKLQRSLAGIRTVPGDPQRPAAEARLTTRLETRKDRLTGCVLPAGINLLERGDLL